MTIPYDQIVLSSPGVQFAGRELYSGINRRGLVAELLATEASELTSPLAESIERFELAGQPNSQHRRLGDKTHPLRSNRRTASARSSSESGSRESILMRRGVPTLCESRLCSVSCHSNAIL